MNNENRTKEENRAVFNEVQRISLAQKAAASISEAILSGKLRPGTQVVEADIADQMNISRAPVREALRILEEEGLVEHIPYKGTYVTNITVEDIRELYSLRSVLEAFSVRLAVERANPDDIGRLEEIVNQMLESAEANDMIRVTEIDLEFHRTICEISRHKLMLQTWIGLEPKIRLILGMRHRLHNEVAEIVKMHQPLLEAICRKDSEEAVQLMTEHIVSSGEFIVQDWLRPSSIAE